MKWLRYGELIGLKVKVLKSTCRNLVGKEGIVVDETKNTLVIENHKLARVAKLGAEFEFTVGNKKIVLKGSEIAYRPEDRIKRMKKVRKHGMQR